MVRLTYDDLKLIDFLRGLNGKDLNTIKNHVNDQLSNKVQTEKNNNCELTDKHKMEGN